jgi:hypothetical protein
MLAGEFVFHQSWQSFAYFTAQVLSTNDVDQTRCDYRRYDVYHGVPFGCVVLLQNNTTLYNKVNGELKRPDIIAMSGLSWSLFTLFK